jgi:hypothetical protein
MSGDAVSTDGTLKDAGDIEWFNDADDTDPIPPSRPLTASSSASSVTSIGDYFTSRPPVKKVGGERHSSRIYKPSKRAADPDNAEAAGSAEDAASGQKRKVGGSGNSRRVTRKVVESDSSSEKGSDHDDLTSNNGTEGSSDEEDQACTDAKYDSLKALGDKDREVLSLFYQVISYSYICSFR